MNVNDIGITMYAIATRLGPYNPSMRERLLHVHSEVTEAYQCVRDGDMDLRIVDGKPEGLPAELADVVIIVAEIAEHLGIDLDAAIKAKLAYNAVRPWRRRA